MSTRQTRYYVVFHSDRGSEYTAIPFRRLLDKCNVIQSFSKKAYPYDNACCESFFRQMKREELSRRTFHTLRELYLSCFEYIERYNSKRPHSSLNYLTPNEAENCYWNRQKQPLSSDIYVTFRVHWLDCSPIRFITHAENNKPFLIF